MIKNCIDGYPSCRNAESTGKFCKIKCEAMEKLRFEQRKKRVPTGTFDLTFKTEEYKVLQFFNGEKWVDIPTVMQKEISGLV